MKTVGRVGFRRKTRSSVWGVLSLRLSSRHNIETAVDLLNFPEVCPSEFLFMRISGRQIYTHTHTHFVFCLCTFLGVFPIKLSSKLFSRIHLVIFLM